VKSTVIHDRYGEQGFTTALTAKADEKIRRLLLVPVRDDDIRPFQLAKKTYKMCVNHDQLDIEGANPLFELIKSLGGWELITRNPRESQLNWQELYEKVLNSGISYDYIMSMYLTPNPQNNTNYIIKLIPPGVEDFNRGYYYLLPQGLNSTLVAAYYDYMKEFTVMIGATEEDAKREMLEVLEFEQKLYDASIFLLFVKCQCVHFYFLCFRYKKEKAMEVKEMSL
jgi:neprilysin